MPSPSILVVDDDHEILESLSAGLCAHGYQVATAADGLQAIMAARRTSPALIVLDVILPGGTGLEVLKRLRAIASTSKIPVIATTSNLDPTLPKRARDLGASAFMLKPMKPEDLVRTIERILQEVGGALPGSAPGPAAGTPPGDAPLPEAPRTPGGHAFPSAAKIWEQFRDVLFERLVTVESGVAGLVRGTLTDDLRQKTILESHRLAGSLGMLGMGEGSRVAREIEQLLVGEIRFGPEPARQMARLAGRLRQVLEKGVE
jgi:CheY-like chemotaxis protein